jgi:hypothetical protein
MRNSLPIDDGSGCICLSRFRQAGRTLRQSAGYSFQRLPFLRLHQGWPIANDGSARRRVVVMSKF